MSVIVKLSTVPEKSPLETHAMRQREKSGLSVRSAPDP